MYVSVVAITKSDFCSFFFDFRSLVVQHFLLLQQWIQFNCFVHGVLIPERLNNIHEKTGHYMKNQNIVFC